MTAAEGHRRFDEIEHRYLLAVLESATKRDDAIATTESIEDHKRILDEHHSAVRIASVHADASREAVFAEWYLSKHEAAR